MFWRDTVAGAHESYERVGTTNTIPTEVGASPVVTPINQCRMCVMSSAILLVAKAVFETADETHERPQQHQINQRSERHG